MHTITTEDGYTFHRQPNGTYTDREDGNMELVDLWFGPITGMDRLNSLPECLEQFVPVELSTGCDTVLDFILRYHAECLSTSPLEQFLTDELTVLLNIQSDEYYPETLKQIAGATTSNTIEFAAAESFIRLTGCDIDG